MISVVDFTQTAQEMAKSLIGSALTVSGCGGIVVETEAYDIDDAASHSHRGQTPRNAVMFGPPGRAYVYRSHGLHWCLNVVCGTGPGSAVLIRAIEPIWDVELMQERRLRSDLEGLCSGPGKLCQAMAVNLGHNGLSLTDPPFSLTLPDKPPALLTGPRIGISKNADAPWRFGLAGSRFLSRRFPPQA
jgi:DNA-3-methyladenine glycosylase